MSSEPFSLLDRPWLPVRRRSGTRARIRPADITGGIDNDPDKSDPVVAFDWGRGDFDAAAREFLLGLISIACREVLVADEWQEWWDEPPEPAVLDAMFAPFAHAFVLDGDGPRFLQEFGGLAGETTPVGALLVDQPGGSTARNNTDLFVKRGRAPVLGRAAAAMALFTLQAFAPSGGAGHRVSLRGGGPLSVLLLPGAADDGPPLPLWHSLWLNAYWDSDWDEPSDLARVFPWLAPTRTSTKGEVTAAPDQAHPAQAYWGMPRRIALAFAPNPNGLPCGVTGEADAVAVAGYVTRPHGVNYAGWSRGHPLTPYYRQKPADLLWLPVHGQPGRMGYRDWIGLVVADVDEGTGTSTRTPAAASLAAKRRAGQLKGHLRRWRLSVAGYDMDNMKPRGFVESQMPVQVVRPEARKVYDERLRALVLGGREAAGALSWAVGQALFGANNMPASDAGARALARGRFFDRTEAPFHVFAAKIADVLPDDPNDDAALDEPRIGKGRAWLAVLREAALAVFDGLVPHDVIEERLDMGRLIEARRGLGLVLHGYGKGGVALFKALELPPPEAKKKGKAT